MDIKELQGDQWMNIFPEATDNNPGAPKPAFSGQPNQPDLFGDVPPAPGTVTDETTQAPADPNTVGETTTIAPNTDSVDIVGDDENNKKGRKPKYDFTDASGYFEDRFKSGKFVAIKETTPDGQEVDFIPKTPEDFDEVIDIQVNYRLDQERKDLAQRIVQSKSPAWQSVFQYADLTDDPADIIPFLQGVKTIQSVADLNENEEAGAEQIIRARLQQRGDDDDYINTQIEALKTQEKLVTTAQKWKASILQEEQQNLYQMTEQRKREQAQYIQLVNEIRDNAVKTIETPLFGKHKLKNEEKAAIYDLIAEPAEETSGYGIYNAIDSLFEKRDFETLRLAALLLANKDSFINYISTGAAQKTAEGIQRQLRAATEGKTSGSGNNATEETRSVNRSQYNRSAKFGRG